VRRLHHLLRRNTIGLRINGVRVQTIAATSFNFHKPLLQKTDSDQDPSTLVL
jgi:hypothetical protein